MFAVTSLRAQQACGQRQILVSALRSHIAAAHRINLFLNIRKDAEKVFEDGLKVRHQPGSRPNPCQDLPLKLHLASLEVINRYRNKKFREQTTKIWRDFNEVFVKEENDEYQMNQAIKGDKRMIQVESDTTVDFREKYKDPVDQRALTRNFLAGDPLSHAECAAYMASRLPANFATLKYVFREIRREEPDFVPSTLFDYGSGIGTTIWAADETWKKPFDEIFCVDLNENMNDLSRELLAKGTTHCDDILNKMFYRQFLPVKHRPGYDLVVSAFSMLDYPDTRSRIHMVENLWKKTDGMLVLIETGSRAGYSAIMEARNFLLQISRRQLDPLKMSQTKKVRDGGVSQDVVSTEGSLVAPCPHEQICPRQLALHKKSYCNFKSKYKMLDIGQGNVGVRNEKFAYIVMKKTAYPGGWSEVQKSWPRVVQDTTRSNNHSVCRLCISSGKLLEFTVSKAKNERIVYQLARMSKWGDKLPVNVEERLVEVKPDLVALTEKYRPEEDEEDADAEKDANTEKDNEEDKTPSA